MSEHTHKTNATKCLNVSLKSGEVSMSRFSEVQLEAIRLGKAQIPGLTWHHHQEIGRMQLLPRDLHNTVKHAGGMSNIGTK